MTLTELKPAPCALIDESGRPAFGVYTSPLKSINLKDFDYRKVAPFRGASCPPALDSPSNGGSTWGLSRTKL